MAAETVLWPGASGEQFKYWVYTIGASFKEEAGNYIFAKKTLDGRCTPIYIGETNNLQTSLPNHEKLSCVRRNGGTHVHAHLSSSDEEVRRAEESDLLDKWDPPCNKE